MDKVANSIFSFKGLAWCWGGLLTSLGTGAVALQLTMPAPAPVAIPAIAAAPPPAVPAPPPPVAVAPVPFQNHSLLAMLPPPMEHPAERVAERTVHPAIRLSAPLPVPPQPPAPRVARVEPRRIVRVYAAERAYQPLGWARMAPYETEYARVRPYAYAAPPPYFGW